MKSGRSGFIQKVFVATGLVLAATSSFGQAIPINSRGDGTVSLAEGQQIWNTIQKIPYAAQGEGPVLYVFVYSTCPYAAQFFHDWNGKLNGIQLRWIFYAIDMGVTGNNSAEVALTRNPDIVAGILQRTHVSPPLHSSHASENAIDKVTLGTLEMSRIFAQYGHAKIMSPTFVWRSGDQYFVARGYTKDSFERLTLPHVKNSVPGS